MSTEPTIVQPFRLPARGWSSGRSGLGGDRSWPIKARLRVRRTLWRAARPAMERALSFPTLNDIYAQVKRREDDGPFAEQVLDTLGVRLDVSDADLAKIPATGPLVVVANHPFGGIEGLVLTALLRRVRPDVRLLANYMLSIVPELRGDLIYVDPFGGPDAPQRNMASMRAAVEWVKAGHVLGVFPSGEVSHLNLRQRNVADPDWSATIARLVRRTAAPVTPVFFDGRNSNLFQVVGMLHPRLRTVMLPRELLNKRHRTIPVRIGSVLPAERMARFDSQQELTAYLRVRTYILRPRDEERSTRRWSGWRTSPKAPEPIVAPQPAEKLADDIEALPAAQRLVRYNEMEVMYGTAAQLPHVLPEIGRLRELSFRGVGEGTGRPIDLDSFDDYYLHLFVWDHRTARIVGAYRIGQTDVILDRYGKQGLYTHTLFHFKRSLLEQIDPALEMGRSFVHPDYQKSYAPLMLLWKGIGEFLAQHPHYRRLFGPVSISASYTSMSKLLLLGFLKLHKSQPLLGNLLRAKNPPRMNPPRDWDARQWSTVVRELDEVDELVRELETDHKPIPVLLRQYLKLNAVLLGFNVDPAFGEVLDGLVLIDVLKIDPAVRQRYMGKEASMKYLSHYGVQA